MKISHNLMTSQINQPFSLQHHQKTADASQNMTAQWGAKAADVCISRTGKALSAASRLRADQETSAESSLREIQAGKEQIACDQDRIAEIDDTLARDDGRLTDSDRSALQKERDELEKRSKKPEDVLHEKYQQVRALEKKQESGTLTDGDLSVIGSQISALHADIDKQKEAIQKQGKKEEALMQQALQERVAQDDKTNRALSQKAEHQQAGEAIQKDALQSASDSESQKAVLDILTKPRDKEEQGGK